MTYLSEEIHPKHIGLARGLYIAGNAIGGSISHDGSLVVVHASSGPLIRFSRPSLQHAQGRNALGRSRLLDAHRRSLQFGEIEDAFVGGERQCARDAVEFVFAVAPGQSAVHPRQEMHITLGIAEQESAIRMRHQLIEQRQGMGLH